MPTQRPRIGRGLRTLVHFIPAISDNLLDRQWGTIKYDYAYKCVIASQERAKPLENFELSFEMFNFMIPKNNVRYILEI